MAATLTGAAFALIVAVLWLLAPHANGAGRRQVVLALTPTPASPVVVRSASMGIHDGLTIEPFSTASFGGISRLAPGPPLASAPDPALIETTTAGGLPIIAADGRLPRRVYARPHEHADLRAKVAVIVAGIGLSRAASEAAIERLPGAVVLAIDAYAARLEAWARAGRLAGHELLATVPLQDASSMRDDRGPRALGATASADENGQRLKAALGAFAGYVGVLAVGGTAFQASSGALEPLLAAARLRGLLLVDATRREGQPPVVSRTATPALPVVHIDVVLDPADIPTIDRQLADLQRIADARSRGVALAYPTPATLERLRAWIAMLDVRRYVLAPVSAIADANGAS